MKIPSHRNRMSFLLILVALLALTPGCQNENTQFISSAPPGPENDHPGEGYKERRTRTFRPSKAQSRSTGSTNAAPAK